MRIPDFLKKGDTIGIVAPSFGAVIEPYAARLAAAIRKFEDRGYRVVCADSVYKSDGLGISTDPASAAADLMDFYLDDSIDALISAGGGELMNETISHVDFKKLAAAKPKWYMGYSDNTNFIFPMAVLAGVPGIYGPCATGFGKVWEQTENDAFMLLEGRGQLVKGYDLFELPTAGDDRKDEPLAPYALTEPKILRSYLPEGGRLQSAGGGEDICFSGTLLGGYLDVLVNPSDFEVFAESGTWTHEQVSRLQDTARERLIQGADHYGLKTRAYEGAMDAITTLLEAAGYTHVRFDHRPSYIKLPPLRD